jgi:hypothetical protein
VFTLRQIIATVLLALWLPATQHCDLEAAGITVLAHGDHASSTCKDTCADDACHAIEGVSLIKDANSLRALPAPVTTLCGCLLNLLAPPELEENFAAFTAGEPPQVRVLHRTWQFVRRTALPARAPDFVA